MITHKVCGGIVESELYYSDADNDYYFPVCQRCMERLDGRHKEIDFNGVNSCPAFVSDYGTASRYMTRSEFKQDETPRCVSCAQIESDHVLPE